MNPCGQSIVQTWILDSVDDRLNSSNSSKAIRYKLFSRIDDDDLCDHFVHHNPCDYLLYTFRQSNLSAIVIA